MSFQPEKYKTLNDVMKYFVRNRQDTCGEQLYLTMPEATPVPKVTIKNGLAFHKHTQTIKKITYSVTLKLKKD